VAWRGANAREAAKTSRRKQLPIVDQDTWTLMGMKGCSRLQPITLCSVDSTGVRLRLGEDRVGPGGGGVLLPVWS
jgi:hypothetical protein